MKRFNSLIIICVLLIFHLTALAQRNTAVHIMGAMKNVMWDGELAGKIEIDTISNKEHLYGFGPIEYLKGELLIMDGTCYQATVLNDSSMKVEISSKVKAPFFAYANIYKWKEIALPDSIVTLQQLEKYILQTIGKDKKPLLFKMTGSIESATVHLMNLPTGTTVSSPADAQRGRKNYKLNNELVEIAGFFSTKHQTIFTHHDTFLHLHLITADKSKMGHLDKVEFKKGSMKIYLPVD